MDAPTRRFSVYATDEARHNGLAVSGVAEFLEAAILFAERWSSGDGDVSVTVIDCETGERQCFRIDLDSGEVRSC
jgi:hypothetical protein